MGSQWALFMPSVVHDPLRTLQHRENIHRGGSHVPSKRVETIYSGRHKVCGWVNYVEVHRSLMKWFVMLIALFLFTMPYVEFSHQPTLDEPYKTTFSHDAADDEFRPIANVTVAEEEGLVVQTGTKTVSNTEWNVYRVTLGEDGQTTVHFDGSSSHDPDHANETDPGVASYEWKVLFDAPYGDDDFDLEGHTFSYSSDDEGNESVGFWSYNFANVTVDSAGTTENQIRIELITYDTVGKFSQKFRMYFVVEPNGFSDQEPEFQFDMTLNGTTVTSETIFVNGSLITGSENGDVYAEVAFFGENFNASAITKYNLAEQNLWARTHALSDGDTFSLSLSVESMYSNSSVNQYVFIKTYEGEDPNEGWNTVHWLEFTLAACHGLVAPEAAIEAGGEFVLDGDRNCQWAGAWSYNPVTDEWAPPEPQHEATFSLNIPVETEVMEDDFVFINGTVLTSTHEETYIEVAFENSSFEASAVEKYELHLIHLWNRSDGLSVGDNFSLGLSVESLRGNITMAYNVHVRAFVYDHDDQQMFTYEDMFGIVVPYLDTDEDGTADELDAFPTDPSETLDSDGDGVGDNSDAYPNDPSSWEMTDEGGNSNESLPGFEFWLLLFALFLATRVQRKLTL